MSMSGGAFSTAYDKAFDVLVDDAGGDGGEVPVVAQCKLRNFSGRAFTEYNACKRAARAGAGASG